MGKYFILFALACAGLSVSGRTLYVSPAGTNDYNGYYPDWTGAAQTISAAVTQATTSGDLICVTSATYAITTQISVTSNITIRSWNNGNLDRTNTIVDGQRSNRCFYINNSGAIIAGFTIRNGSNTYGGGVYINTSGGTVSNCIITDNLATGLDNYELGGGGGVLMMGSAAVVRNCVIQRNQRLTTAKSTGGAGVFLMSGGLLKDCEIICNSNGASGGGGGVYVHQGGTVDHCSVTGNVTSAGSGSGVLLYNLATATLPILFTNCTVATNTAVSAVGALYANSSAAGIVITDCLISNNTGTANGNGQSGGAVLLSGVLMRNCQIVNNWSPAGLKKGGLCIVGVSTVTECVVRGNYPGGVSSDSNGDGSWRMVNCLVTANIGNGVETMNRPKIINCTVVSNTAIGITDYASQGKTTCTVVNAIVYLNPTANYTPTGGSQYFFTNSCIIPLPGLGTNNITNDPSFVEIANGNYRLRTDSPCVNAGTNNEAWMATGVDLDGQPRLRYGYVDMGAYELIRAGMIITVH